MHWRVQDTIQLDVDAFSAIGLGTPAANAFVIGSAATTADHRIIYDPVTGALYYDADGHGAGTAVQLATLGTGLALTNADFVGGPSSLCVGGVEIDPFEPVARCFAPPD